VSSRVYESNLALVNFDNHSDMINLITASGFEENQISFLSLINIYIVAISWEDLGNLISKELKVAYIKPEQSKPFLVVPPDR
jgi:hypothetical protein